MSNRTNQIPQALSIEINQKVYKADRDKIDIVKLSYGEAFFEIPLFDFNEIDFNKGYHYSDSRGLIELREKISKYYYNQYSAKFNYQDEIIITTGSKIAIYMALLSITDYGDHVLVFEPAWLSYKEHAKLCGLKIKQIPITENIYKFDKYLQKNTKVIIINNPNNPSGKLYNKSELKFLYEKCQKLNIFLLVDEAYSDYILEEKFYSSVRLDKYKKNLIVINSISKNFGMSGWRVGYIISNKSVINNVLKLNQHLITCPPTVLLLYLNKYFQEILNITLPQIKNLVIKRNEIINFIKYLKLEYLNGSSTFYIFLSIAKSKFSDLKFADILFKNHRISVVPGSAYGESTGKYIRISIGVEETQRIKEALKVIKNIINENK